MIFETFFCSGLDAVLLKGFMMVIMALSASVTMIMYDNGKLFTVVHWKQLILLSEDQLIRSQMQPCSRGDVKGGEVVGDVVYLFLPTMCIWILVE